MSTVVILVKDGAFEPPTITINPGDTVRWEWVGSTRHSCIAAGGQAEFWDSGILDTPDTFEHTFSHIGCFTYYCGIHGADLGGGVVEGDSGEVCVEQAGEPGIGLDCEISPRWAFTGLPFESAGDVHTADGVHVRLGVSELLGLPVLPFAIYRANLGQSDAIVPRRTDVTWTGADGFGFVPPFAIPLGTTITAWLPPASEGATCCWFKILTASTTLDMKVVTVGELGLETNARTTVAPYELGASHIEAVVITGTGTIDGAEWIAAEDVVDNVSVDIADRAMGLPVESAVRYVGLPGAVAASDAKVEFGAPARLGLYEAHDAATPVDAPTQTQLDEVARVNLYATSLFDLINPVVGDATGMPWAVTHTEPVLDPSSAVVGETEYACEPMILAANIDPGIARWLGFLEFDESPLPAAGGEVMAYIIRGIWEYHPERLEQAFIDQIPDGAEIEAADAAIDALHLGAPVFLKAPAGLPGPFLDLCVVVCYTVGAPPDKPGPPTMGVPVNGPWLPATAPDALREITFRASDLILGGVQALARREGVDITGLNPIGVGGRPLPLAAATPADATEPGLGDFNDLTAPQPAVFYRLAQTDPFGRWSEWAEVEADEGERPGPPRPVLQAFYTPPPSTPTDGPLSGELDVRIPVPGLDALAPGSLPLAELRLTSTVDSVDTLTTEVIGDPLAPPDELQILLTGPPIERTERETITLTAVWVDTDGTVSEVSDPLTLELTDPRPPEQVTIDNTLQYSSRPDVTGKSRSELTWNEAAGADYYRVYYADETRLLERLGKLADAADATALAILADVDAAAAIEDKAAVFTDNSTSLTRDMFEPISGDPIRDEDADTVVEFAHEVSGSLRVLSFYRIVSVSDSNVESAFLDAPIAVRAVPNTGPPAAPLLKVTPSTDPTFSATLEITVPQGQVIAEAYRLRRSTVQSTDVNAMGVVQEGAIDPPATEEAQVQEVVDDGTSFLDPDFGFRPWTPYYWRVEVQGASEPGGGPPGKWSPPSAPVSTLFHPPDPPEPADLPTLTPAGVGQEVRWTHPDPLYGGRLGIYALDLYRRLPGEREELLTSISADAPPADGGRLPDRTGEFSYVDNVDPVPTGTRYRVVVIDPIGRMSAPSDTATV